MLRHTERVYQLTDRDYIGCEEKWATGALSLSQHQQCGTHYLPNYKTQRFPTDISEISEDAIIHQRFLVLT